MKEIILTSTDNAFIKSAKELHERKHRKQRREFLIEGEKMFIEACRNNAEIKHIFVLDGKANNFSQFIDNCDSPVHLISEKVAAYLSTTVTVSPVFAIVSNLEFDKNNISEKVLILDNLQDPGNVGTLLRTAAAANFNTVMLINCVDIYNEKVIRSTMGGLFKVQTFTANISDIKDLKEKDYEILIADMKGTNIFEFKPISSNIAVVIGNEGSGVSDEISNLATSIVSIPMAGNVESLNAAVSGAIIMYQLSSTN